MYCSSNLEIRLGHLDLWRQSFRRDRLVHQRQSFRRDRLDQRRQSFRRYHLGHRHQSFRRDRLVHRHQFFRRDRLVHRRQSFRRDRLVHRHQFFHRDRPALLLKSTANRHLENLWDMNNRLPNHTVKCNVFLTMTPYLHHCKVVMHLEQTFLS